MKFRAMAFTLASIIVLSSCSKSDNSGDDIGSVIVQGNWVVHYYLHNGAERTSDYSSYIFTFASNHTISASKSGSRVSGVWSQVMDSGKKKLIINWTSGTVSNELMEIEEDWIIVSTSSTLIELSHTSGGGSGTDQLHFHKA